MPLDGHDGRSGPFIAKAVKLPHPREMEAVESCPEPVFLGGMTDRTPVKVRLSADDAG